jgi:hypothetical protein
MRPKGQYDTTTAAPTTGVAVDQNTNTAIAVNTTVNSYAGNRKLRVVITTAADTALPESLFIPGTTPSKVSGAVLADARVATSVGTNAEFKELVSRRGMVVSAIRVSTTDTDNWNQRLTFGEVGVDGRPVEEDLDLIDYIQSSGSGAEKALTIKDRPINITPLTHWKISGLKANTSITFEFEISHMERGVDGTKPV